jgi:hypothetical protein
MRTFKILFFLKFFLQIAAKTAAGIANCGPLLYQRFFYPAAPNPKP